MLKSSEKLSGYSFILQYSELQTEKALTLEAFADKTSDMYPNIR